MRMPAISIRQPFAWAIIHGGKDIENRTWPTRFRGRVLIHAGKAWHDCRPADLEAEMKYLGIELSIPADLPRGGIVGVAEIVDCINEPTSPWFEGPWGFVISNPRPLEFLPCKGALGFFSAEVPGGYLDQTASKI